MLVGACPSRGCTGTVKSVQAFGKAPVRLLRESYLGVPLLVPSGLLFATSCTTTKVMNKVLTVWDAAEDTQRLDILLRILLDALLSVLHNVLLVVLFHVCSCMYKVPAYCRYLDSFPWQDHKEIEAQLLLQSIGSSQSPPTKLS